MIFDKIKYTAIACAALALGATSCVDDLNVEPKDPSTITSLESGEQYYQFMAQLYGGLVLSGVNGESDITVDDPGAGVYSRQLWNLQELCTDEAFIGKNWNDAGIDQLDYATWSSDNHWLYESMSRFIFQITMCNEFLRQIDNAASCAVDPLSQSEITQLKAEARVLRALSYYHMMDTYGRGPWVTEANAVGEEPQTLTRAEMFPKVVADLSDAIYDVAPAAQQIYGRVSREGAWMLLAKLYLNAEVYTGTPMWNECARACQQITATINQLAPEYKYLFCATNDKYVGNGEILWGIPQDKTYTQTYGGTTYLSMGAYNADLDADMLRRLGNPGTGWSGPRVSPELANAFGAGDKRYLIYEGSFTNDLANITDWAIDGSGYMCIKYVYTGEDDYYNDANVSNSTFNSADFPLFRLADTYLMLAECELHGVSCNGQAYLDMVRDRAGQPHIELTAENLLDERMRELYWEGHRRSDLIRFGKFTGGSYLWSWKGGAQQGQSIDSYRNLYCVPTQYISTLGQNAGYNN